MPELIKIDKVGVEELKGIAPGQTKAFWFATGAARASAQSQAYRMPILNPRDGVLRYACKSYEEDDGYVVEITAVRR